MRTMWFARTNGREESGQALLVVVVAAAMLAAVVFGAQEMVGAQTPTVASVDNVTYALQAAHAGVDDYLTQLDTTGIQNIAPYCSQYFCGTADLPPSIYPEFANCPHNSTSSSCPASPSWATTGVGDGVVAQYQYMVDSKGFNVTDNGTQSITVWSTGRAGAHGQWAYQTVRATVFITQSGPSIVSAVSTSSCSANETQWVAPPGATYAEFTILGGSGGDTSNITGGYGQIVTGAIAVEPGWTFTASAGHQGGWGNLESGGLAYAQGGPGGCGNMAMAGGNGGGYGTAALSTTAGGGGAGSGLCFGTEHQCSAVNTYCSTLASDTTPGCMIAAAGGGGGAGGSTAVIDIPTLFDASVNGGQGGEQSNLSANGANGQELYVSFLGVPLINLPGGAGGTAAYTSSETGQAGQQSAFALVGGAGGGGGGGFNGAGGGGGEAGQPGSTGVYDLVDIASGGGGGGQGAGTNSAPSYFWQTGSCTFTDSGTAAGDGSVTIQRYGGSYCSGNPVMEIGTVIEQVAALP